MSAAKTIGDAAARIEEAAQRAAVRVLVTTLPRVLEEVCDTAKQDTYKSIIARLKSTDIVTVSPEGLERVIEVIEAMSKEPQE